MRSHPFISRAGRVGFALLIPSRCSTRDVGPHAPNIHPMAETDANADAASQNSSKSWSSRVCAPRSRLPIVASVLATEVQEVISP